MTAQEMSSTDPFPIMDNTCPILIFICGVWCAMPMETQKDKKIPDSLLKCLDREQKERDISIKFG